MKNPPKRFKSRHKPMLVSSHFLVVQPSHLEITLFLSCEGVAVSKLVRNPLG